MTKRTRSRKSTEPATVGTRSYPTWRRRSRFRGMWLPERAVIERISATLIIGFFIGLAVWLVFFA